MFKKYFNLNKLSTLLLYTSIFIFTIAFNFSDNRSGGWYQQFLPNLNNKPLEDIQFLDSLTGYGITNGTAGDSNYVIKTTNGGDNWFVINIVHKVLKKIEFINSNTGYVCGGFNAPNGFLMKTTNAGLNWIVINTPFGATFTGMYILNEDTIWVADFTGLIGGLFRTTNGGASWIQQYSGMSNNPRRIYMINSLIGFFSFGYDMSLGKTTDGGFSWFGVGEEGFSDIYFIDTLTGWKASGDMKKTTDGGLTWITQNLPITNSTGVTEFSNINADTIWAVGGEINFQGNKGIVYKTTNGGKNWGYQIPNFPTNNIYYYTCDFVNKLNGWGYTYFKGIHSKTGGDTITIYVGVHEGNINAPDFFLIHQNYPNPFNPKTVISYQLTVSSDVKLKIFDIEGKELQTLVNKKQNSGEYKVEFDGTGLTSGVYFYRMEITDEKNNSAYSETKKMILIK